MATTFAGGWYGRKRPSNTTMKSWEVTWGLTDLQSFSVVELFRTAEKVSKRQYPKERAARELTAPGHLFILNLVVQRPGLYEGCRQHWSA